MPAAADRPARHLDALLDYAERVTRAEIARWPAGAYRFTDYLDSDGFSDTPVPLTVAITVHPDRHLTCAWSASSPPMNACPRTPAAAVAAAAGSWPAP